MDGRKLVLVEMIVNRRFATTLDAAASSSGEAIPPTLGIAWMMPQRRFDALGGPQVTFGRAEENAFCLPDSQVSRVHAQVTRRGPELMLTDLGSKNGTSVNRRRGLSFSLGLGDVVRMGGWLGVVMALRPGQDPLNNLDGQVFLGPAMIDVFAQATRASQSDLPLIVWGETGTGKEVLARTVHRASARTGKFIAVNCAALPETIAEAELFGYRKGAFTGANQSSAGYFRAAHQGTLLLDEVVDLPLSIQAKLLRVLETKSVTPLGESSPVAVDVRVLAAGQELLAAAVESGRFRADLYARLRGVELRLPPLRQRREEILAIFSANAQVEGRAQPELTADAAELLLTYSWPMNVREVVQVARQMTVLHSEARRWSAALLPETLQQPTSPSRAPEALAEPMVSRTPTEAAREADSAQLLAALAECGGNISQAAARVGISRQRAYRLLRFHPDVNLDAFRSK